MDLAELNGRGLVLVGCGRMGGALLKGWLARGIEPGAVAVIDPDPPAWLSQAGVAANGVLPDDPAVLVIAVKPQMMGDVLPRLQPGRAGRTLVLSVAAGVTLAAFARAFPGRRWCGLCPTRRRRSGRGSPPSSGTTWPMHRRSTSPIR